MAFGDDPKIEAPNSKQITMTKIQNPKPPLPCGERGGVRGGHFEIGVWNLFGFWDL
jgi:hypothetical protein